MLLDEEPKLLDKDISLRHVILWGLDLIVLSAMTVYYVKHGESKWTIALLIINLLISIYYTVSTCKKYNNNRKRIK